MSNSSADREPTPLVSLADEAAVKAILESTVTRLWQVVNDLSRLRPSRRERYRVAIFGSARAQPGTFAYEEVKRVAAALAGMGCDIVTGGGPGLMQAANEGAKEGGAPGSVGIALFRSAGGGASVGGGAVVGGVEAGADHHLARRRLHHDHLAAGAPRAQLGEQGGQ